jgi:hypothetical protein
LPALLGSLPWTPAIPQWRPCRVSQASVRSKTQEEVLSCGVEKQQTQQNKGFLIRLTNNKSSVDSLRRRFIECQIQVVDFAVFI